MPRQAKIVAKKKRPKILRNSSVRAKGKQKKLAGISPREIRNRGWMVVGFDTSMSSVCAAGIGYDATLKTYRGPEFFSLRWSKEDHYFDRLKAAAKSYEFILDLQHSLGLALELHEIWIAQEEPWPMGMVGTGASAFLKQQAEISGAFLGGLIRYGFQNVSQMNSIRWRQTVAADLGITVHHSKWRDPELALRHNSRPEDSGKFRAKQWALDPSNFGEWAGVFDGIPDWPDIIESTKLGKVPRPEGSRAKAVQADDRYDALAIAWTHYEELLDEGRVGAE